MPDVPDLMPRPVLSASTGSTSMATLLCAKQGVERRMRREGFWGEHDRWLLGTVLPPFQRPVVWDEGRMTRFVESAWLGLHLGTYVVNEVGADQATWRDERGRERFHPADLWLVDGQQRLTALDCYWDDVFPVFGHFWSDLSRREQRRFENVSFPKATVRLTDEDALRDLYDRMNYGGVAHAEEQRAMPRP